MSTVLPGESPLKFSDPSISRGFCDRPRVVLGLPFAAAPQGVDERAFPSGHLLPPRVLGLRPPLNTERPAGVFVSVLANHDRR